VRKKLRLKKSCFDAIPRAVGRIATSYQDRGFDHLNGFEPVLRALAELDPENAAFRCGIVLNHASDISGEASDGF